MNNKLNQYYSCYCLDGNIKRLDLYPTKVCLASCKLNDTTCSNLLSNQQNIISVRLLI